MQKKYLVVCLAITAIVGTGWWWLNLKPISAVERRVKAALSDPDSAKFQGVQHFAATGGGCGEVNARNRMGGYTGFVMFVAPSVGDVTFAKPAPSLSGNAAADLLAMSEHLEALNTLLTTVKEHCPGY